jgi:hypothetical protein
MHNITGKVGVLSVTAGFGGSGTPNGGAGGDIDLVKVTPTYFVQKLRAGVGGLGSGGTGIGGAGGDVSNVTVIGDIGSFTHTFGMALNQMGGLFAGAGGSGFVSVGTAGSLLNITAKRVAAILAADGLTTASTLKTSNAVSTITNLVVSGAVTADTGIVGTATDGAFSFNNAGAAGFNLGDGDTAIDGLVIVKAAAAAAIPASAIKIIVVP